MKLPVDTSAIAFLCALAPEPVVDFETKRPTGRRERRAPVRHPAPGHGRRLGRPARGQGARRALLGHPPGRPGQGDRPGRPALDHGRPLRASRSGRPGSSRPSPRRRRADERRDAQPRPTSGGAGRPAVESRAGPSTHQGRVLATPDPTASGVSPMMPLDRMPSISLGIIVLVGAVYDSHHHWRTERWRAECLGRLRRRRLHQRPHPRPAGRPAGAGRRPPRRRRPGRARPSSPPAARGRRGWPADVGRQPRLPRLRDRLAYPLPLARAGR